MEEKNGAGPSERPVYTGQQEAIYAARRKRRRQERLLRLALVLFCFAMLAVTGGVLFRFLRGRKAKPAAGEAAVPEKTVQAPPELEEMFLSPNEYSRPGTALDEVKGIVIHYTANPGTTAAQNRDYFEGLGVSGETYASSHFIVGIGGEAVQCIPLEEIAYASNERNADTIAIECCIPDESGEFTEATYQTLLHLTAWLMGKYGLGIEDVIRHYDVTGKACPKYYVEYPIEWERLKQDITAYIDTYGES